MPRARNVLAVQSGGSAPGSPTQKVPGLDGLARFQQAWRTHDQQGIDENRIWCTVDAMYDECGNWEDYFVQRNAPQYEETLEEERDRMDYEMFIRGG